MTDIPFPDNPPLFMLELQRRDFCTFFKQAWPRITGGHPIDWNWHLDAMANELGRIERGENKRLLVTVPPRHSKSKMISVIWVAWLLGQNPTRNAVCISYSGDLSAKFARDCLAIMQSHWYRELFPRTVISTKRFTATDFDTTVGGGRVATSVTGTITGRGGDFLILDDIIKPDEANSKATREKVNDWYKTTLLSRLDNKLSGPMVCVMQRLHQDDLAGILIESGEWQELSLPAIATRNEAIPLTRGRTHYRRTGDILHPEREPQSVLDELKASMGSIIFSAQYQQDPVPESGNIIKREWLKTYDPAKLELQLGQTVQSWDTASKDNPYNDFSACITALVRDDDIFILDVVRERFQFHSLKQSTIELARKYDPTALLIEDQASGTQLIQSLHAEKPDGVPRPIARRPEGDKLSRVMGVNAMIEAGQLHLPNDASWLATFQSELLGFPSGRFDDQVDALSQLLTWVRDQRRFRDTDSVGAPIYGR